MSESIRVLYRTSIAVVSWVDNNTTFARLYVQDTNGGICESLYDGKSWTAGKVVATAKANSPIAACVDPFHQFLCVFYITTDNIINGMRFGLPASVNQWTPEAINGSNFQASPTSRLAVASNIVAEVGFDVIDYTLYYQKPDGSIGRLACWADKYTEKTSFGAQALAGTGLAAINFRATDEQETYTATRIFYQLSDGSLTDVVVDRDTNSFNPGEQDLIAKTKGKVPPNTNLSAISTGSDTHPKHQLYSAYSSGETVAAEWGYYSGTWKHANPAQIPLATDGGIAVFNDPNSVPTPLLKVYAQHYTSQILEYTAEDPWVPWKISAIVPTGIRGD